MSKILRLTPEQIHRCLHGVGYEIFVQSFFDSNKDGIGDLNGLREKLDYLSQLGISLIWLMPIHPAKSHHKYDVEDYRSVHSDYGTLDDFRCLINECHQREILVILDLVANHTSYDHPWFQQAQLDSKNEYRDYYIWSDSERVKKLSFKAFQVADENPAGLWHRVGRESQLFDWETFDETKYKRKTNPSEISQPNTYYAVFDPRMPDLNYDCERVQNEICQIGRFWLELGVDGFRIDAAKYFHKPSQLKLNLSWWTKFRQEMSQINPFVYLIGEVWDYASHIAPYLRSLDSVFNFELAEMFTSCIINEGNCSNLLNSYLRIQRNYLQESQGKNFLDTIFLSNHDQNRIMSTFDNDISQAKMAAALLLTFPGLPFIYYGEEIGMLGMTPTDKYRREPFFWSTTNLQGQTTWLELKFTKTRNGCIPLDQQLNDPNSLFNHYKTLIHLRCQSDVLRYGELTPVSTRIRSLCLFERIYKNQSLFIVHNISTRKQRITLLKDYSQVFFSTQNDTSILKNREFVIDGYSTVIFQSN